MRSRGIEKPSERDEADRQLWKVAERIPPRWHIQICKALSVIAALKEKFAGLSVPAVIAISGWHGPKENPASRALRISSP